MFKKPVKVVKSLQNSLDLLEKNHLSRVGYAWFKLGHRSALTLLCAVTLITLAIAGNAHVRYAQLQLWQSADPSNQILDAPTFSTADAPYFLRHVVDIQRGDTVDFFKVSRSYPNNLEPEQKLADRSDMRERPLLSVVLAKLTLKKDKSSLVAVGNMLLVVTSALTAAAIAVCFGAAGIGCRVQLLVLVAD